MNNHNILPYILYLTGNYDKNLCLVSKFWDDMYIRAVSIYPIRIIFKSTTPNHIITNIMVLPRFSNLYILDVNPDHIVILDHISFTNTRVLDISHCDNIKKLPLGIDTLKELDISYCKISELHNFTNLVKLKMVNCKNITKLPTTIENTLEELDMRDCLQSIEMLNFTRLIKLKIINCKNITKLPTNIENTLEKLDISYCIQFTEIPNFTRLIKLKMISCKNITKLPTNIENTLEKLDISYCIQFTEIPNFTRLIKLILNIVFL